MCRPADDLVKISKLVRRNLNRGDSGEDKRHRDSEVSEPAAAELYRCQARCDEKEKGVNGQNVAHANIYLRLACGNENEDHRQEEKERFTILKGTARTVENKGSRDQDQSAERRLDQESDDEIVPPAKIREFS